MVGRLHRYASVKFPFGERTNLLAGLAGRFRV
jgi:hypothetical protein